jgi:hypothetical protein
MKRRTLLKAASLSALAMAWGGGLQLADAAPGRKTLADAVAASKAAGRPLLVFVFHKDSAWEEGQMYGSLLSHGTDAQLAPLAAVDIACASEAQVKALWPAVASRSELLLVPATGAAPAAASGLFSAAYGANRDQKEIEAKQFTRMDKLAQAVHTLVWACPAQGGGTVGALLQQRDAAGLAAEARTRHHGPAPTGGQWMIANGCGASPEATDATALTPPCGMGMVTELGRRFLELYAE